MTVVSFVDEQVDVELTRLEACHGAADPRVDLDAVAFFEDEGEAEGVDVGVWTENESVIDEVGEELGLIRV